MRKGEWEGGGGAEAEFLDVIGTKKSQEIFSLLFTVISTDGFYSPHLSKSGLKLVCNVNIRTRNLNEIVRS